MWLLQKFLMHIMRLKFGERRRNDWTCCFCCHVRTGTIFLGLWHLMLHVLALSVIAVVLRHPEMVEDPLESLGPALPTPLSEVDDEPEPAVGIISPNLAPNIELSFSQQDIPRHQHQPEFAAAHTYANFFAERRFNNEDLNVGVVVTFCTFAITLLMVFGAVKGKPSYLMPFFCLQVFDFCIASLTAVGYLCYLPDIHRVVAQNMRLPFRDELLRLNPQCLSLLVLLSFMIAMMVKAYFIGVVWSCYKYLSLRLVAAQRTIHYIDPDSQSLLPELPDYETAMGDPRFAATMKKFPTPPPSYTAAVATVPVPVPAPAPAENPPPPPAAVTPPPSPPSPAPVAAGPTPLSHPSQAGDNP